jgi:hypothetical protein
MELKLDSPFLTRLLEVVASGIGAVSRPWMIRRLASADADASVIKARAEQEIQLLLGAAPAESSGEPVDQLRLGPAPESKAELRQRTLARLEQQELKRQANIEIVFARAANEDGPAPPPESPDPDWVARFFGAVQDISSSEMQFAWGKILAGEIRRPGTYSLRTLEIVRNLTTSEADGFRRIAGCIDKQSGALLYYVESGALLSPLAPLVEAGLFHSATMWTPRSGVDLEYPSGKLHVTCESRSFVDVNFITEAGRQLLPIVDAADLHQQYFEVLVRDLVLVGYQVVRLPA